MIYKFYSPCPNPRPTTSVAIIPPMNIYPFCGFHNILEMLSHKNCGVYRDAIHRTPDEEKLVFANSDNDIPFVIPQNLASLSYLFA